MWGGGGEREGEPKLLLGSLLKVVHRFCVKLFCCVVYKYLWFSVCLGDLFHNFEIDIG